MLRLSALVSLLFFTGCEQFSPPAPPPPATGPDPETTLSGAPRARTRLATASFQLLSEASATFQCSLDGEAFAPCTGPKALQGLRAGTHVFRAYAVLPDGRFDKTPAAHSWEVITTLVETNLTSVPQPVTSSTAVAIAFSSPDADATFECSLGAADFATCTSPQNLSDLTSGTYRFRVRAVDADGVRDETPAEVSWRVDTEAPAVTITQAPPEMVEDPQVTVVFQANKEGLRLFCKLDANAYAPCQSPYTLSGLTPGTHQFSVQAEDQLGVRSTPATASFTVKWRLGAACAAADDCTSGFCRDGSCCDEGCSATCRSCGIVRGTCTTVRNATDLDSCSGTNICNDNGTCGPRSSDPTFEGFEFSSPAFRFRGNFPAGRIELNSGQFRFQGRLQVTR